MTHDTETIDRLCEIKEELLELLEEAKDLLPDGMIKRRAEAYWLGHIRTAIDDDHSYLGSGGVTIQTTIDELENGEE